MRGTGETRPVELLELLHDNGYDVAHGNGTVVPPDAFDALAAYVDQGIPDLAGGKYRARWYDLIAYKSNPRL